MTEAQAAQAKKFGYFGGVFTPSVLTILGVIMYLRLPWVVGNAGLLGGWLIILVAILFTIDVLGERRAVPYTEALSAIARDG